MELTPDQLSAARACGCCFSPATDDQIRRFSAQRRVFRVEGAPFVATRDGGFFETWATLAALVDKHRTAATGQGVAADAAPSPEHDAQAGAEPSPVLAEPQVAPVGQDRRDAAAPKRRRPRTPRPEPAPAAEGGAPTGEAAPEPSEAEEMLAGVEAAQDRGPKARVVGRRRAGQSPTPRWMVAGKARRGRLK